MNISPTNQPNQQAGPQGIPPELEAAVLQLNNAHATELSWLDTEGLRALLRQCFHARAIGNGDAFLLALQQGAVYDSPNYAWFQQRFEKFVYVDRIVVGPSGRGRGLARQLYQELIARARAAGHSIVVCEVNVEAPNPASDALHAALGFAEIGMAAIHGGAKTVRYLARALDGANPSEQRPNEISRDPAP